LLLQRLVFAGIPAPVEGEGCLELGLGPVEESQVAAWLSTLPADGGRPWIAIGPGAKQPVKRWPLERYWKIGVALIDRFDVWPVVFGGSEDKRAADLLIHDWKRGYNAAGALDVRAAIAAMRRCKMYLGNDTGVMHMAATAGIRCVAVFASHGPRGVWNPYGNGHRVFRTRIDCEGCLLEECRERASECIMSITAEPVLAACVEVLEGRRPRETFLALQ
jgi:heptosyltransferase-2